MRQQGPGRRKVYQDPKKIIVRFSGPEYAALQSKSDRSGVPITQLVRKGALDSLKIARVDAED